MSDYDDWVKAVEQDIKDGLVCPKCVQELVHDENGNKGCTSCDYMCPDAKD